ncbi:MAG: carboxypeptidase-like regulatory domain-containing protein [Bacteroidaceae bacterium]|nr:carboxypeptidase-like regulatory domain-containing protein [Bacteroidaceae bacterium]
MKKRIKIILTTLSIITVLTTHAQSVRISGHVHDTEGNALPYTTVRLKGLAIGCTTDNKGNFSFNGNVDGQTLVISSVGYKDYSIELSVQTEFPLDVELSTETYNLDEVIIKTEKERYRNKNNPAVELIEEIIRHKEESNPFNNEYVSRNRYETYVVSLDDFTEEKQQQGMFRKFPFLKEYVDTSLVSGKPILNVSTRELAATDYFRLKPKREKQVIHGREWVGIEDFLPDEEVKAAADATLRDIDLFNDKVLILRNEFISPFSNLATLFYKYYVLDTLSVDGEDCIDLAFLPRNPQSLGFTGHIYITTDTAHFVKWIQMNIPYDINLNFIEYMNIEQKFTHDINHPRLLVYESITAELKLYDYIDGIYGRREVSYSDYRFNDEVDREPFYHQEQIIEPEEALQRSDEFWEEYRKTDINKGGGKTNDVKEMISRLRKVPIYYWTEQFINLLFSGYIPVKENNTPFYIGPVNTMVSWNGMEGVRLKLGGMTTAKLNPHLFGTGYLIYGINDNRFKYYGRLEYSFKPKKEQWNEFPIHSLRLQYENDIYQYGQQYIYTNKDNALLSLKRLPDDMIGYIRNCELTYTLERHSGLSFTGTLRNRVNESTGFIPMLSNDGFGSPIKEISQSELEIGLRYAPGEKFIQHKWNRKNKTPELPVFTLNGTLARKGVLGSNYSMLKTDLSYRQRLMAAPLGYFDVMLKAGKIWGQVPYPLLYIPNANLSYTYRKETFETITPMEFFMDSHITWDVVWYMNGLFLNRIPAINKMKLREVTYFRGIWGTLSSQNNPEKDSSGNIFLYPTRNLSTGSEMKTPFIEAGVGIENIFKIMSVSYFRRMTYKNTPDVDIQGVRIAVHLQY